MERSFAGAARKWDSGSRSSCGEWHTRTFPSLNPTTSSRGSRRTSSGTATPKKTPDPKRSGSPSMPSSECWSGINIRYSIASCWHAIAARRNAPTATARACAPRRNMSKSADAASPSSCGCRSASCCRGLNTCSSANTMPPWGVGCSPKSVPGCASSSMSVSVISPSTASPTPFPAVRASASISPLPSGPRWSVRSTFLTNPASGYIPETRSVSSLS